MTDVYRESQTATLMLPREVEGVQTEANRISEALSAPPHISAQIQDRNHLRKQLRTLKDKLETQTPKPLGLDLLDTATRREKQLREQWMQGMPTQAEMRRNPAGAVGKHQDWEKRNKGKVREWKNIRRRLHVSGDNPGHYDDPDISNIERFRPAGAGRDRVDGPLR